MSNLRKILLIILALIYVTHVYSRLVHTPPIYIHVALGSTACSIDEASNKHTKSFILHRRHLPLLKKIEIGKLYPVLLIEQFSNSYLSNSLSHFYSTEINYNPSNSVTFSNKAPPAYS